MQYEITMLLTWAGRMDRWIRKRMLTRNCKMKYRLINHSMTSFGYMAADSTSWLSLLVAAAVCTASTHPRDIQHTLAFNTDNYFN